MGLLIHVASGAAATLTDDAAACALGPTSCHHGCNEGFLWKPQSYQRSASQVRCSRIASCLLRVVGLQHHELLKTP